MNTYYGHIDYEIGSLLRGIAARVVAVAALALAFLMHEVIDTILDDHIGE